VLPLFRARKVRPPFRFALLPCLRRSTRRALQLGTSPVSGVSDGDSRLPEGELRCTEKALPFVNFLKRVQYCYARFQRRRPSASELQQS